MFFRCGKLTFLNDMPSPLRKQYQLHVVVGRWNKTNANIEEEVECTDEVKSTDILFL